MPGGNGQTLRAWRRSRGWDVPEMARQLRIAARQAGIPVATSTGLVRMIYAWERGDHRLTERYELMYAAALGIESDQLADGPPRATGEADVARPPLLSLTLGMTDAALTTQVSAQNAEEEDRVDRRSFGMAAMGLLAGTLVPPARTPATASVTQVRDLHAIAEDMWTRDWTVGGTALLREAVGHYAEVRAMLDRSRYTGTVGRELQALAADLAASAGFIAFDAGEQQLARSLLSESVLLTGNDPLLTAHTYALLALQSTSAAILTANKGRAREALRFLDQAADAARHEPSPRLHATIWMRRATASALLEDDVAVRQSIANARRELDRGDHPADPHWASFVTPSEVTAHEAMARLGQGRSQVAARLFRDVLADPELPPRNRALYQARLATSLHAAGDRANAVSEGLQVLTVLEGPVKSARTLDQLRSVRQAAPPDSEFAVRFDAAAAS